MPQPHDHDDPPSPDLLRGTDEERFGRYLSVIERRLLEDPDGGNVFLSRHEDGWTVGVEWGREAPDSPMAGAAAYGAEESLVGALTVLMIETGWMKN